MNPKLPLALLSAASFALVACSTVQSRIATHRAQYDTWPPQVQQQVSAGQIGIGFTREQVQVALGNPDSVFSRTAVNGSYEVWTYGSRRPRWGIGVGMGSFHGGTGFGGGVRVNSGHRGEHLRVVFDASGRVSQIEQVRR